MRIILGFMWLLHFLPLPILGRFGNVVGSILYWLLPTRRHITQTNLRLCFPEKSESERNRIAVQHFQAYSRSIFERSLLWWSSEKRLRKLIHVDSAIPLKELAKEPLILLCPHFVSLDVAGIALTLEIPLCSLYVPQKNKVFDRALKKGRHRFGVVRILTRSEGIKPIIRAMQEKFAFFMLPDLDFGIKGGAFIPFFGVPAATLMSPGRIAAATKAKVVPIIATMLPNYQGWKITLHPAWENYPGDDLLAATHFMSAFWEEQIRLAPAEYFWSHRRFKTRPEGEPDVYKKGA